MTLFSTLRFMEYQSVRHTEQIIEFSVRYIEQICSKPFNILNRWHDLEEECCEFEQFGANHHAMHEEMGPNSGG